MIKPIHLAIVKIVYTVHQDGEAISTSVSEQRDHIIPNRMASGAHIVHVIVSRITRRQRTRGLSQAMMGERWTSISYSWLRSE